MVPGLDMYYTDPAQRRSPAGKDVDGLEHGLFDVCSFL